MVLVNVWELCVLPGEEAHSSIFVEGWEPFAVAVTKEHGERVWLRRQRLADPDKLRAVVAQDSAGG